MYMTCELCPFQKFFFFKFQNNFYIQNKIISLFPVMGEIEGIYLTIGDSSSL